MTRPICGNDSDLGRGEPPAGQVHVQGRTDHAHQTWAKALNVYLDVEAHTAAARLRHTLVTCCASAAAS